ncbi:MAG TPA: hypothetical protein V6C96_01040, partial [Vampirovibrionales bacterium]
TIVRRFIKKQSVMQPDSDHIHHRILKAGLSPKSTMIVICTTCALLASAACVISGGAYKRYFILMLMTVSLGILSGFWRREAVPLEKEENLKEEDIKKIES